MKLGIVGALVGGLLVVTASRNPWGRAFLTRLEAFRSQLDDSMDAGLSRILLEDSERGQGPPAPSQVQWYADEVSHVTCALSI